MSTPKIRDRIKSLRRVPAKDLIPNPKNWRTHPKEQREALAGVLQEVGLADAVLARETPDGLMLLDGHLRQDLAPDTKLPVLVLDVTEAEADVILATHDPLAAMAGTSAEALDGLLREVNTSSEALQEMISDLAGEAGLYQTPEVKEDEPPEPPTDPITKPGDLWILGRHRLLCGDSTKAEDVARLMDGARASCVFTDPPYGVSIANKNKLLNENPSPGGGNSGGGRNTTAIVDDDLTPEQLEAALLEAFVNLRKQVMADDCTLFVCSPQGCGLSMMMMMMMMMMQTAGLKSKHVLIWVKNQPTFSMGRLDYDYQHEPILLTWQKRHKRPMKGEHKTSVWRIDKPRKSEHHPTMKPVELYANAYLNNSDDGDVVADIYSGSGTAFIAAEQLDRTAFGLEISPAYCDVIVERWETLTGKKAKLEKRKAA